LKSPANLHKSLDANVLLGAFDHSDVRAVTAGPMRKFFLRQAKVFAALSNPLSDLPGQS